MSFNDILYYPAGAREEGPKTYRIRWYNISLYDI